MSKTMQESANTRRALRGDANKILVSLLIMDFLIRGHLWKFVSDQAAAYRCYWICDSITYALCYLAMVILTTGWIHRIMIAAFPFAINKVIESVFTDRSQFDWTEYACLAGTIVILAFDYGRGFSFTRWLTEKIKFWE